MPHLRRPFIGSLALLLAFATGGAAAFQSTSESDRSNEARGAEAAALEATASSLYDKSNAFLTRQLAGGTTANILTPYCQGLRGHNGEIELPADCAAAAKPSER